MSLIVQKFGGSSVRDAERVRNVAGIIADFVLLRISAQIVKEQSAHRHLSSMSVRRLAGGGVSRCICLFWA